MAGYTSNQWGVPTLLASTSATAFKAGVVAAGGVAKDTILNGLKIAQNGTAVTVTVAGFMDSTGAAANIVFTGSTTQDTWVPLGWLNTAGALTFTASVANKVVVETIAAALF